MLPPSCCGDLAAHTHSPKDSAEGRPPAWLPLPRSSAVNTCADFHHFTPPSGLCPAGRCYLPLLLQQSSQSCPSPCLSIPLLLLSPKLTPATSVPTLYQRRSCQDLWWPRHGSSIAGAWCPCHLLSRVTAAMQSALLLDQFPQPSAALLGFPASLAVLTSLWSSSFPSPPLM